MPKLCQINALVTGRKAEVEKVIGDAYKVIQKEGLFNGMQKTYRPYDDESKEKLPQDTQKVQFTVKRLIEHSVAKWSDLWDLTATQDAGNQKATSDVIVDDVTVLSNVPVTTLLFLEKQVNDVESFVSKLPTPDPSEDWTYDSALGVLKSSVRESVRSKKEPSHYEKAAATKEHAAQVEFFYKDVPVGMWSQISFSGAIEVDAKNEILARIKKLKDALKIARENANSIEVNKSKIAESIFGFILG